MKKKLLTILLSIFMMVTTFTTRVFANINTIQDVLNTVDGGFPTTEADAWSNDKGKKMYINGSGELVTSFNITNLSTKTVVPDGNNYVYQAQGDPTKYEFVMNDGVLEKVIVSGITLVGIEDYTLYNGEFAPAVTYEVAFGTGSWTIGDVTVTCDKNGTKNIGADTDIVLTNFNPKTMEVIVSSGDFSVPLNVNNGKTSLNDRSREGGYPDGTLTFVVQAKNQDGPGPGPGPQPELDQDGYPVIEGGNLKIMTEQSGFIGELKINGQGVSSNQDRTKFATKVDNPSSFKVQIQLEFGKAVSSISINNTTYTGDQLTSHAEPEDKYTFNNISADQNGMLELSFVEAESTVSTIIWTYDENDPSGPNGGAYSEDALVKHGKVEIVSIKRNQDTLYENGSYTDIVEMEGENPTPASKIVVDIEGQRGYVRLEKGDNIVIKLIPDYGYQLKTATINERTLAPLNNDFSNVSTFKLDNVQGQMHFSGVFEETNNTYSIAEGVTKVSNLSVNNNSTTVTSGTLKVSLNNANNFDVSSVNGIGDYTSDGTVDITIDNIVSQGTENNYWSNNISEFNDMIDVSMNVGDYDPNYEYKVVRKHGDEVSIVDSSIDSNGVLTFSSKKFSSYMILKKEKTFVPDPTPTPEDTPKYKIPNTGVEGTPNNHSLLKFSSLSIFAVGIYMVIKKKKDN